MKWMINMKVKDYVRNWSNQEIHTEYKGISADIKIKDTDCVLFLEGDENVKDVFRLIWELLFLYDGYFYSSHISAVLVCRTSSVFPFL